MADDPLVPLVGKLAPDQLQQLHTALYQARLNPPPNFNSKAADRLWGVVNQTVSAGPKGSQTPAPEPVSTWQEVKNLAGGMQQFAQRVLAPPEAGGAPLVMGKSSLLQQDVLAPLGEEQKKANATTGLESMGHAAASYIPFIGPIASRAGELIGQRQYGAGALDTAMAVLGARGMGEEATRTSATEAPKPNPINEKAADFQSAQAKVQTPPPTVMPKVEPARPTPGATESLAAKAPSTQSVDLKQPSVAPALSPLAAAEKPPEAAPTPRMATPEAAKPPLEPVKPAPTTTQAALKPAPVEAPVPVKLAEKTSLEDTIRQAVKAPSDARSKVVLAKASDAASTLPKDEALKLADSHQEQAQRANAQAQVIRQVLDRQGDVAAVKEKLGAWAKLAPEIDPDTGQPIEGAKGPAAYVNSASPAERDLYNQLLGRKLETVKAFDQDTGRRIQPPKVGSPEEAAQVDEFVSKLSARRDEIVSQIKAGFPTSPETLQEGHELTDQITQLTGMRSRYPAGVERATATTLAGKAQPVVDAQGVWRPDPNAPLPELTQQLYNRLMGRDPDTRLRIKPENLERRIGELNAEASLRTQVASTLRSAHGAEPAEQAPLRAVEQKLAPATPKSPRPAAARVAEQAGELADNLKAARDLAANPPAPEAPALPPKPADQPGFFTAKVLDEKGVQTGWKQIKLQGPGTPGVGQSPDPTGNTMSQMAEALRAQAETRGKPGLLERIKSANGLGDALSSGKDAIFDSLTRIKATAAGVMNVIARPDQWNDFKANTGRWSAALQEIAKSRMDFREAIEAAHPDKLSRVGISNWVAAGGDAATLERWRDASQGALRKGYQRALDLDDNEKTTARNLQNAHDELWQQLHDAGMLEAYVHNYLKGIWKSDQAGRSAASVMGSYRVDSLRPNLAAARAKFYANYFEGEQAGKVPYDKDAGFLFDRAWTEGQQALASRAYIRGLHEGTAEDGMPIAMKGGSGTRLGEGQPEAYVINARGRPEEAVSADGRPYMPYDHPALRQYIYATGDENGAPIFVKGDAYIHPDLYQKVKNQLAPSFVRQSPVGRLALNAMGVAKQFMLSLSAFHQAQIDPHGMLGHLVNPTSLPKVNLEDPVTSIGLDHGLQLYDPSGHQDWSEGLATGGLVNRIPGLGPLQLKYNNWFWGKHMPELKQAAFAHIYDGNMTRYGADPAYDFHSIALKSASETNASFGGLNYKMLARSAGMQDMFRVLALSPDFLEARARFVGQAAKRGGLSQSAALARIAVGFYGTYRVGNMLANNGDPKWDKPFSLVVGDREYQMRSLPGDMYKAATDPYSFIQGRENPFTVKPALELATRRDDLGRRVSLADQAKDVVTQFAPFSVQKAIGVRGEESSGILDSALESIGVSSKAFRTPALETARQLSFQSQPAMPRGSGNAALRDIENAASKQSPELNQIFQRAVKSGSVSMDQAFGALDSAQQPELVRRAKQLNLQQLQEVWAKASPAERGQLIDIVYDKHDALEAGNKPPAEKAREERAFQEGFK